MKFKSLVSTLGGNVSDTWPEVLSVNDIKAHMHKSVKGQDEALDLFAYVGNLYLLQLLAVKLGIRKESLPRLNLLVTAPTGIGKTFLIKKFGEALGLSYYRIDCSATKAEGWHGTNLSDQIYHYLCENNSGHGVLHLDEVDKLMDTDERYTSKFDLQSNLLDLLNGEYSHVHTLPGHKDGVKLDDVNFSLIIMSGSFQSMRNDTKSNIGFVHESKKMDKQEFMQKGFIQELEARIIHSIELKPYEAQEIKDIIENSEESPYKKYLKFLGPKYLLSSNDINDLTEKTLKNKNGLRDLETELFKEYYRRSKSERSGV